MDRFVPSNGRLPVNAISALALKLTLMSGIFNNITLFANANLLFPRRNLR
jgi:hypothetical protein